MVDVKDRNDISGANESSRDTSYRAENEQDEELFEPFKVFISHSSKQKEEGECIGKQLENAGFEVFLDTKVIQSGENWWERIEAELHKSGAFICLNSKKSQVSWACQREVGFAQCLEIPILPVPCEGKYYSGASSIDPLELIQMSTVNTVVKDLVRMLVGSEDRAPKVDEAAVGRIVDGLVGKLVEHKWKDTNGLYPYIELLELIPRFSDEQKAKIKKAMDDSENGIGSINESNRNGIKHRLTALLTK